MVTRLVVAPGVTLFKAMAEDALLATTLALLDRCPARRMTTPGGKPMSVAMSNCGTQGWISDRRGYRYTPLDPLTGRPWPELPASFAALARAAADDAGFADFCPEACLINFYDAASRMGPHQDRDEQDLAAPIVSVSFGLSAQFRIGGSRRGGPTQAVRLDHGDVLVFGGPARLAYHGIDRVFPGSHRVLGEARINLTFRRVGVAARTVGVPA